MEKKIVVLGGIGKTDRENRDNMRVLAGGGSGLCAESPHRQGTSSCNQKIQKAGQINNHQWGVVYQRNGIAPTMQARDYKYPATVIRRWERES